MKRVEFTFIERFALGILIGFSYLPKDEETNFDEKFTEIQDTRIYYVLKRMELENKFEWI